MRIKTGQLLDSTRPLDGRWRWARTAPLLIVAVIAIVTAIGAPDTRVAPIIGAAALTAAAAASNLLPWERAAADWQALPAIAYFILIALLEYAAGTYIDFFYLIVLPIIWLAIFHTRPVLLTGLAVLTIILVVPRLLTPASYPDPRWTSVIMTLLLSAVAGLAGQHLLARMRAAVATATAAAQQARADRDTLNAYLNHAPCLVAVMDPTGGITYLNRYAERLLGVRTADVFGVRLFDRSTDPEIPEQFGRIVNDGTVFRVEDSVIAYDGSERRVSWTSTALRDDDQVTNVISIGIDVTDQRTAEQHLAHVLDAAVEQMIFATDTRGILTVFNKGAERLVGYRAEELIGRSTVEAFCLPEELDEFARQRGAADFAALLARASPDFVPSTQEWTLLHRSGGEVPVSATVTALVFGGRLQGYVCVARDITEERAARLALQAALDRERQASEQLRELNRVKDDFVAMVSHDLRTPLTSIVGSTELLLDAGVKLPRQQLRLLEAVDRNARRLQHLIADLLVLSRIESGTLELEMRPVSITGIVNGAMEALAAKRAEDITVTVTTPPETVDVHGDPDQLERMLVNLVGNAFKYTPPGGRVEVTVSADQHWAHIRVADTGIGIPPDELPHIFERFYRSGRAQNQQVPGTGLGLTIAKSIVEGHGGAIEVSSTPANGTTFTIALPRLLATTGAPDRERA